MRTTGRNMDRVNYSDNKCNIGNSGQLAWKHILEDVCLYGHSQHCNGI